MPLDKERRQTNNCPNRHILDRAHTLSADHTPRPVAPLFSRRWLAEHPKSLFLFDEENPFRKFCRSIARSAWFDTVIFAVIFANTVTMASLDMRDPNAQNAEGMAEAGVREHDVVRGGGAGEDR